METRPLLRGAAARTTDAGVRQLLGDLAEEERKHSTLAERLESEAVTPDVRRGGGGRPPAPVRAAGRAAGPRRADGRLGLDARAAVRRRVRHAQQRDAFLVGLAAASGAGISMGFAEALSDDGSLTGRGHPWIRGFVCGLMTTLGGIGHTLPTSSPTSTSPPPSPSSSWSSSCAAISYIRHRYMDTPLLSAAFQVVVGGVLVFLAGILLGVA